MHPILQMFMKASVKGKYNHYQKDKETDTKWVNEKTKEQIRSILDFCSS